jgi:nitrite reductase/ring-hydroxylating ferredoxin subunit
MQIERRKFLESACKACLMAGAGFLIADLTACGPASQLMILPVTDNTVIVPLSAFKKQTIQIVRPQGWFYDIAIRKISPEQYEAILMECTHQKNQLISTSNGFMCTLHGSRFNLEGNVLKGPAERPLKKFNTSLNKEQLAVLLNS